MTEITAAIISLIGIASHTPSIPNNLGKTINPATTKSKFLENDKKALTLPLFKAVKKLEVKIVKPLKIYERENRYNPCKVKSKSELLASINNDTNKFPLR